MKSLKFIQVNLGRGSRAQDLLLHTAKDRGADILLLTEPYRKLDSENWFQDDSGRAAIVVCNPARKVGKTKSTSNGFVWIEVGNVRIYSCYFSPNDDFWKFEEELEALEDSISGTNQRVLVTGDFNSKHPEWGETRMDRRGILVSEMLARKDLVAVNEGTNPTFERGASSSIIDITLADPRTSALIEDWGVLDEETLSDHFYIGFNLQETTASYQEGRRGLLCKKSWNVKKLSRDKVVESIEENILIQCLGKSRRTIHPRSEEEIIESHMKELVKACNRSMPKRKVGTDKGGPKYWWSEQIGHLRKACVLARRKFQRSKGNEHLKIQYKRSKALLGRSIRQSKQQCWKELISEVDEDPWGLPYKIVFKKLRGKHCIPGLNDKEWVRTIILHLFPSRQIITRELQEPVEVEPFTLQEIQEEGKRLKTGKSPGPDGIPNELLKVVTEEYPELLQEVFNACLRRGTFVKEWKIQKLVLLRKGKKPLDSASSYRPICLLNTMGKMLEGLLIRRLEAHLEENRTLADNQFGFRKGRSTTDAVNQVLSLAKRGRQGRGKKGGFCALIAIDIRNAFNSLGWKHIHASLEKRQVPKYIRRMIHSYLSERIVVYEGDSWVIKEEMSCGAPQGSCLGPLLWNVVYDDFLRMDMLPGVEVIGFADDALITIQALDIDHLERKTVRSLKQVKDWLEGKQLEMAVEKTEAVLVTNRRGFRPPRIMLEGREIQWKKHLTYLGVEIDSRLSFGPHIEKVAKKAAEAGAMVGRLMPNVEGPREKKRRLLASVVMSRMLYAAPAWGYALKTDSYKKRLTSVQRQVSLRIVSAYKTVSTSAVFVLASTPPVDLLVAERQEIYTRSKDHRQGDPEKGRTQKEARVNLLNSWQCRWDREKTGRWTHSLIPNIKNWMERSHGESSYYLTQVLTGHGCFRSYLQRIGKLQDGTCEECGTEDTARHVLFECIKYTAEREALFLRVGRRIHTDNLIETMLSTKEQWETVEGWVRGIITEKERELRQIGD